MKKPLNSFLLSAIHLDRSSKTPLYRQIYASLQRAILTKQLPPGLRLPSTRDLATNLNVSRNTIINAVDQLVAEGYLETRPQSGTYITHNLPEELLSSVPAKPFKVAQSSSKRVLSKRGLRLKDTTVSFKRKTNPDHIFAHGMPAFDHFPYDLWAKLVNKQYRYAPMTIFSDNTYRAAGYKPLRQAIAEYLRIARAVQCDWEQVLIVSGSQQGVYLAAQTLLDPGDEVWMEEPGYLGARAALLSAEARLIPVPIDSDGLEIEIGCQRAPKARCAYVTPSHQFPLGGTMSLTNRLKLLNWAEQAGAWIIEDDYDSEYRYSGQPIPSLQGLDSHGRVIYVGTFSKVLFPSIRLGYLVVPSDLVDSFMVAKEVVDLQNPNIDQAALTDFIQEGHFNRHLRRMRMLYAERWGIFREEVMRELAGGLALDEHDAGMHTVGWLPPNMDDYAVFRQVAKQGLEVVPLSSFYLEDCPQGGLVMGCTAVTSDNIRRGVRELSQTLATL